MNHGGARTTAPSIIGRMVLGTAMATEFQKPPRMPSHDRPVQALLQAWRHGSNVTWSGSAKIFPSLISSIVLTEVTSITYSGTRKNSAALNKKA